MEATRQLKDKIFKKLEYFSKRPMYKQYDEHRIALFIALCFAYGNADHSDDKDVWKSIRHSDGSTYAGWFILGMNKEAGKQITYHIPISKWDECYFAKTLEKAPEFDGHTSQDVLERIKQL